MIDINNKQTRIIFFVILEISILLVTYVSVSQSYIIGLALVFGIIGLVAILSNPFWGIIFTALVLPIEQFSASVTGNESVLRYVTVAIFASWLLAIIITKRKLTFRKNLIVYLLFFVWAIVSITWAEVPEQSLPWAQAFIQIVALLILFIDQVNSLKRLRFVIYALIAGGVIEALAFYLLGVYRPDNRLSLVGDAAIATYGYPLSYSMALFGVLGIFGKRWERAAGIVCFIIGIYPMVATGLRGALLAIFIGILSIVLFEVRGRWKIIIFALLFSLITFYIFTVMRDAGIFPVDLLSRFSIEATLATRASTRFDIWNVLLNIVKSHPIFGLGLNQFSGYVQRNNLYTFIGSHNDYLEALVSLGGIGFILFAAGDIITLVFLLKVRKYVKPDDFVLYSAIFVLLIAAFVGQNSVNQMVWKYVWVIRALAIAASSPLMWTSTEKESLPGQELQQKGLRKLEVEERKIEIIKV